jgi:hypothetical protein
VPVGVGAATKSRGDSIAAARAAAAAAVPASEHVDLIEMAPSQPGWLEREEALLRDVEARGDPVTEATPAGTHDSTVEYIPMAQRADDAVLKEADVSVRIVTKTGFDIVRCVVVSTAFACVFFSSLSLQLLTDLFRSMVCVHHDAHTTRPRFGRYGNVGPRNDIAFFHARTEVATAQRLQLAHHSAEILEEVCSIFGFNAYYATLFYQRDSVSRFMTGLGSVGQGQGLMLNIWPIEQQLGECGGATPAHSRTAVRSDPFAWCYFYGLCIHKLAHFHYVNHGTIHDFFMDELRIEHSEAWIELLLKNGFDPAKLCTSDLSHTLMFTIVN